MLEALVTEDCNSLATSVAWATGDVERVSELAYRYILSLRIEIAKLRKDLENCAHDTSCNEKVIASLSESIKKLKASSGSLENCVNAH